MNLFYLRQLPESPLQNFMAPYRCRQAVMKSGPSLQAAMLNRREPKLPVWRLNLTTDFLCRTVCGQAAAQAIQSAKKLLEEPA
jgi:hypothetical protein